jgi:ABC-type polysaccharide/polyol phosphate transport system ATPase subunit
VARAGILVLASHDIGLIQSTCNRAILLEEGRIAAAGATEDILGRYLGGAKA